jgi:hypothetical protein
MTVLGNTPPPMLTGHPLVAFADAVDSLLDAAGEANAWTMTPAELRALLPRLTRASARLEEVELRVLREADRQSVGDDVGATITPVWWAHVTGQRIPAAHGAVKLAAELDDDSHAATRAALAQGRVNTDQAKVVLDAVEALPADLVDPRLVTDAEAHLVALADLDGDTRLDPKALRIAGRKILEVLAPDIADAHEARQLEAEERQAAATATLTMRSDGHGSVVGRFKIPELHGAILAKHLNAIAAPKHQHATGRTTTDEHGTRVSRPLRLGQAFCEYLETRDTACDGSPKAGGIAATVVVTMTYEQLLGGLEGSEKAALLDTGEHISPSEVRRLACEAGIIPAVLGSQSQLLDVGRKSRFHNEPQRIGLMLKDGRCAVAGLRLATRHVPRPPQEPWSRGGKTSVDDGVLLCPRHHSLAHDDRSQLKTDKHGKVSFARRT